MSHPPKSLQPILWSADVNRLELEKDKGYIIPQVLVYGTLEEITWLFRVYSRAKVAKYFVKYPMKLYPKELFLFIKNYLLRLQNTRLDADDYVTSFFGPIKQRTADSL